MAVTLTVDQLMECIGASETEQRQCRRLLAVAKARVCRFAPLAPKEVSNEAVILYAGWLRQAGAGGRSVFPNDNEGRVINVSQGFRHSGAHGLLSSWRVPRAAPSGRGI